MCRVIAIANQKGGVGKTTTSVNLGIGLARAGKKVLLVEADAQGSMAVSLGIREPDELDATLVNIMEKVINDEDIEPGEGIIHHEEGVGFIPANIELAGLETALVNVMSREMVLRQFINNIRADYDFILIDCPPSLNLLTINALTAADTVIVPIQCEYYALEGLNQVLKTIDLVKRKLNPELELEGVVFTMYDARTNLSLEVVESVKHSLNRTIYNTIIPRNVRLAEAPSHGMSINVYESRSTGAESYRMLAAEVMSRGEEI